MKTFFKIMSINRRIHALNREIALTNNYQPIPFSPYIIAGPQNAFRGGDTEKTHLIRHHLNDLMAERATLKGN